MDAAHHRALTGDSCYIMLFCAYCLIFYLAILLLHCIMEWMLWDFIKLHKISIEFHLEILFLVMYNISEQMFGKKEAALASVCRLLLDIRWEMTPTSAGGKQQVCIICYVRISWRDFN